MPNHASEAVTLLCRFYTADLVGRILIIGSQLCQLNRQQQGKSSITESAQATTV